QDIEKFMKYFPEAIEKGSAGPFEFIGVAKDGTEVPATTTLSLLKDAQGKPHGIFCIVRGKSELKRAEEKYAAVIDAMPDALIVLDTNGVILSVNPALTKMLGWKPEERVGKSFDEFGESIKAEDIERFMELLGKLIETGHVEPIETVLRAKDGREVPTSVTYSLIKDAEGNPQNIIASLRDISETKKLISELEESKNILDSIFNSTIDSIAIVNLDGVITEISQSSLERSGYSKEEITGRVATFLISEEDRAKFPNLIGEVMEEGFVKNVEITEITKDGRKIPVMFNAALMRDATKGEPIGIVAIARDITELKHAEEERRKAEAIRERAAIIDAMGDGLIVTDLEGNITLVNRAFLELYGYKEEELIGISAVNTPTIKPEHIEKVMGFMKEVIEKGSAGPIEMSGVTGDGKEIHTSFIASLLKDTQDNPTALFAVTRDITETKKLEQELLQSTKMVFLGIMAGGVAHEIRNPLAVINGAAQLLEKRCVSDKFVQKNIKVIRDAVSRASKVVSELLHFARSEPHTSFEPLSVNRIVEDSLSILENQLNIQQIKVKKDLADDLPLILGNANQLQQVIMNLMLNAQSAMPSGGDLTLETTHHNSQVVIKCSDKGEGISADDLGKIFDPFYTTKAPGQGTGLGLSISYQIVQQHGGIIEAYSTGKNCGSTFTIKLPQGELS
nr:PAS domain S-box protein [bacterium]